MNKASRTAFVRDLMLNPAAREALQANVRTLQATLPPAGYAQPPAPPSESVAGTSSNLGSFTLVQVFNASARSPLPVPIDSNLPAIELPFGLANGDVFPKIWSTVDTGAVCTCGNSLFFGTIAARFPHIIQSIVVASEAGFSPLTLAGIVSDNGSSVTTTKLPIAFTFHTSFVTYDKNLVLYTIAVGPKVAVNFLLGLPFMNGTKATINFEANVIHCPLFRDFQGFTLS